MGVPDVGGGGVSEVVGAAISEQVGTPGRAGRLPAGTAPTRRRLAWWQIDLALLGLSALLNLSAYLSLAPHLVALVHYATWMGLLLWPKIGGLYERRIFSRVFAVGFLMAGVAAIYATHLEDPVQLGSDASTFFDIASGQARGISLYDLTVFFEGALAIVLWGAVYDFFAALGFPRERYVGVLLNTSAVALAGVLAIKIARQVYGQDPYRFRRLIHLFSACGLVWLFAGIHIRDSMVLLGVTALVYVWSYFLVRPDLSVRLLQLVVASGVAALFLWFLRREFMFVPIAMAIAGVAALLLGRKTKRNRLTAYILLALGMVAVAGLLSIYFDRILIAMTMGQEGYLELATNTHGSESLGMSLIANQPLPIRLFFGSIALMLFPIPVWIGFQLKSAYHLFGSFNAIFFYFFIPLLAQAVRQLWKHKEQRTPAFLFILIAPIGFTLAVAATSVETRHFGAFLVPLFVLALLPDLRTRAGAHSYRQLLALMFGSVIFVHALWMLLKVA
jgi:hypothetical protein